MTVTTTPEIIIGGPISRREWIIGDWYRHVEAACEHANVEPTYLHVLAPWDPTNDHLDPDAIVVHTDEQPRQDRRAWNHLRYRQMVEYRNAGLTAVRQRQPRWFLSLDSDIILHQHAITSLIDALENPAMDRLRFDVVGGKCFMGDTRRYPSYGMYKTRNRATSGIQRLGVQLDENALFPVDVIMAIKCMTPAAYQIDYEYHPHGEDLGWCNAVHAAGLRIGWDGRVENHHRFQRNPR